jgi:hypothetical protein
MGGSDKSFVASLSLGWVQTEICAVYIVHREARVA